MNNHTAFIEWAKQNPAISKLYVIFADEAQRDPYWLFSPVPSSYRKTDITGAQTLQYDAVMAQFTAISADSIEAALKGGYIDSHETVKALFDAEALIVWVGEQEKLRNYPAFGGAVEKVECLTHAASPAAIGTDWAKFTLTIRVTYTIR